MFFCASAAEADPLTESDLFLPAGFPLSPAGFFAMSVAVVVVVVALFGEVEEAGCPAAFCASGGGEPAAEVSEASDMASK